MPISELRAEILRTIAANRSPNSYLAGATVLHRDEDTPRYSQDLDFFHDVEDQVACSAEQDAQTLRDAGYGFDWQMRTPTFHRAVVSVDKHRLKLEWAQDSAFRFFPVEADPLCGYRLHDADAATNKLLALAGRSEIRDFVDVLHLDANYLSLGSLAWAACGKDPGFTPDFLLDQASRHTAYTQSDLDRLSLRKPLSLTELKVTWLAALDAAKELIASLPAEDVGCLYLNADGLPVNPTQGHTRHHGSLGGAWPTVSL